MSRVICKECGSGTIPLSSIEDSSGVYCSVHCRVSYWRKKQIYRQLFQLLRYFSIVALLLLGVYLRYNNNRGMGIYYV